MSKKIAQLTKVWARPRVGKAETGARSAGAPARLGGCAPRAWGEL